MPRRVDARGWIAVAWALFWGGAYALTAIQARGPRLLGWLEWLVGGAHRG